MKTINLNGKREAITYKNNTGMYTRFTSPINGKDGQYGADIYTVNGRDGLIVLVGTSSRGVTINKTAMILRKSQYLEVCELHSAENGVEFHNEIMSLLGFR